MSPLRSPSMRFTLDWILCQNLGSLQPLPSIPYRHPRHPHLNPPHPPADKWEDAGF